MGAIHDKMLFKQIFMLYHVKEMCAHCCMSNNKFLCCVHGNGSRKIEVYVDRKKDSIAMFVWTNIHREMR